ncbi:MAG TPA: hypothetical protein VGK35_00545 [Actinotalea sp.]|jgi:hypothetical protein
MGEQEKLSAVLVDVAQPPGQLVQDADQAMYEAERGGGASHRTFGGVGVDADG